MARRRSLLVAITLVVACVLSLHSGIVVPAAAGEAGSRKSLHLVLLIGQSNMAGRGKVSAQDRQPHDRVLTLDRANEWVPAVDPLHFDKPKVVGVGLGRTFGIDYANAYPNATVGLIPCAVGGSSITTWQPGGYHEQTKSHPWDDMLPRVETALRSGTLKAILWHQGESDSNAKQAGDYEARLHDLVRRLRSEFDAPNVPFLVGQLGQFPERPWNEFRKTVDAAHRSLPDTQKNTAFVPSTGLHHKGDKTHFNAGAYREFGHRYFQAFQQLKAE